jgi:hypothetical protein
MRAAPAAINHRCARAGQRGQIHPALNRISASRKTPLLAMMTAPGGAAASAGQSGGASTTDVRRAMSPIHRGIMVYAFTICTSPGAGRTAGFHARRMTG